MNQITVIINNRDLLTWPKAMCQQLERMLGLKEIIIIDNKSSNIELLQWYKDCPYKVLFLENLGHTAPWVSGILDKITTDFYVVTDPDLDLSSLPEDTLLHLMYLLKKNPSFEKIGLGLQTDDIPENSPYFEHIKNYESVIQNRNLLDGGIVEAPVDTTFAIYNRHVLASYKICGVRTVSPYVARHIPWYVIEPDAEFEFYLSQAEGESSSYKKFINYKNKDSLRALYASHISGKVSTKWESYFPIYEKWLKDYKKLPVRLLEIGVQNGGSLEIWNKYFLNAELLIGCDINPAILQLKYDTNKIKLVVGQASSLDTYKALQELNSVGFDIIIDDGSHRSLDTISNFIMYFSLLKPGGIFIIEDMYCAYWPEYDGGFFNQRSISNFLKLLFDLVNIEHCRNDFTPEKLFQTFFGINTIPSFLKDGSVYSVSAYNSVYVIQKSNKINKPLLGDCVIVGDVAYVDSRVLHA